MRRLSSQWLVAFLRFTAIAAVIVLLMRSYGKPTASYLFAVFAYTKWGFSMLLGGILVAGAYVLLDRSAFFLCHGMLSRRLAFGHPGADHTGVYAAFVREAREFRAMSAEGIYSDDIVARARQAALRSELDGQELDWGRSWLEFLGTVAPTVGFLGTLVGLIKSFQDLGLGGPLTDVLEGLALSMTTSLLGALISLVFLLGAWLLGRAREVFDQRLDNLIADKQSMDR